MDADEVAAQECFADEKSCKMWISGCVLPDMQTDMCSDCEHCISVSCAVCCYVLSSAISHVGSPQQLSDPVMISLLFLSQSVCTVLCCSVRGLLLSSTVYQCCIKSSDKVFVYVRHHSIRALRIETFTGMHSLIIVCSSIRRQTCDRKHLSCCRRCRLFSSACLKSSSNRSQSSLLITEAFSQ